MSSAEVRLGEFLEHFCYDCHGYGTEKGGLDLEGLKVGELAENAKIWEHVALRLATRQMPPVGRERPSEEEYVAIQSWLEGRLEAEAAVNPNPGQTDRLRRLTRFEYENAVRDLLGLKVDAKELLPKDESSLGFDHITVSTLSSTLLNRYLSAAQKISRQATGVGIGSASGRIVRVPPDLTQESRLEGLPPGTRGGVVFEHQFAVGGEYEFEMRLMRDRDEMVEGLWGEHSVLVFLDGEEVKRFSVERPKGMDHGKADAHLKVRLPVEAGAREVGVTFLARPKRLKNELREPYPVSFNRHRHPRPNPAILQVGVTGPFGEAEVAATESRERVFWRERKVGEGDEDYARGLLGGLMRRAFRGKVSDEDFKMVMPFFRNEREFEKGIEAGLSAILANPKFFLRVCEEPEELAGGEVYRVGGLDLATRLGDFLWSSLPDEELIELGESGAIFEQEVLRSQVERMLLDERAESLVTNFAGQWLHLKNLESVRPDFRLFPEYGENLRRAMRRETELFFESVLKEGRPLKELLTADYSFLNERLARHYGIPKVTGTHFRRVQLKPEWERGGLLRQGSVLSVTSYANRTSPVIRGNWVLETILGTPTPPPPPNTPALEEKVVSAKLPMRERLALHSEKASCAACHRLMDPVGFALENYDAVGRWRAGEDGRLMDKLGGLPDGRKADGAEELVAKLAEQEEVFARAVTEKLLVYALGRGLIAADHATIRTIVREAADEGYRLKDLIEGVVMSLPFQYRTAQ
ncbi:MAG: DUF1592 domain-containing protein [Verrucomicrobiota bacterium]